MGQEIQREFEAKNPGPLKHSKAKASPEVITISDDELEEQLGKMDDDWTNAIWDELVRDKPQHWDMHDALRLGRAQIEDPSTAKHKRSRSSSPSKDDVKMDAQKAGIEPRQVSYIDARLWEGKDLNQAVNEGQLTDEQARSIMRLRSMIGRPKPPKEKDKEAGLSDPREQNEPNGESKHQTEPCRSTLPKDQETPSKGRSNPLGMRPSLKS